MPLETTYTNLRSGLAGYLDKVTDDQDIVIVRRRGAPDVAIIPASELSSLIETAHLLRSPHNAKRLSTALRRAEKRQTRPSSPTLLRKRLGLGPSS